jgi:hypothetical protein
MHSQGRALVAIVLTFVVSAPAGCESDPHGDPDPGSRIISALKAVTARLPADAHVLRKGVSEAHWGSCDGERPTTPQRPTVMISGTIVFLKGKGFYRQSRPKSHAGFRTLTLPRFAVNTLLNRKLVAATNPYDAVFVSRRGNWLSPNNVRRQWRQARTDTGLEWVTPHTFRKTVATLIDKEADRKSAAAQLGHANEQITAKHYIAKPAIAPDVSDILNQLGAKPAT